jgi:hypothetical protein
MEAAQIVMVSACCAEAVARFAGWTNLRQGA